MHHTTAPRIILFCASSLALAGCDGDARRTDAPALAPAPPVQAPTVSAPSGSAPSAPSAEHPVPSSCHTIACFSGLIINVHPQQDWPPGKYRFGIKHDGKTTVCNARVPRPPRERSLEIHCNSRGAVWDDGGFEIHSHPAALDIDVVRDGVRLTRVHYDVEYRESSCGGPGCGSYRSAVVDLELQRGSRP